MRNLTALLLALAAALPGAACGQAASPASTTPAPKASATSPLYVPARPADLDVALNPDAGTKPAPIANADAGGTGGPHQVPLDVDAGQGK